MPRSPDFTRRLGALAMLVLIAGSIAALAWAAEPARRYPTPPAWGAWSPELRHADSLLWAYRAADASREALALRDRARARKAAWPEMAADVLAAAADGLLGRGAEAERHARAGQVLARRLHDAEYDRRAMRWLAFALESQGHSASAESTYRVLLRAATSGRDTLHMGAANLGIGYASLQRGMLAPARRHYERALPLLQRARNPVLFATARVGLARTLHELGDFDEEKRIYLELLGQARRANLGRNEVDALNNLGAIEYAQGDAVRAAGYWRLAIARQRALPTRELAAGAVGNLVLALNDLGQYDEANSVLDSAIAIARAANMREAIAQLEVRRGEQLMTRVRPREALQAFRRAELEVPEGYTALLARVRTGMLRARSFSESPQANLDYAMREVQPLLSAISGADRCDLQVRIAEALMSTGRVREAGAMFGEAADLARRSGNDHSRAAVALYSQGCALRQVGLADSARVTLSRAITEWEAWRGTHRGSRWQELVTFPFSWLPVEYADALLDGRESNPRRLAQAWGIVQAGRSRAMLDRLTGGSAASRGAATLTLARAQAGVLAPGDLLLDVYAGQHTTLLFAITRTSVRLVHLPPSDSLRVGMQAWYRLLSAPPAPGAPSFEVTRDLFAEHIFGGVEPEIRAARRVILSLDGALSLVPIEELVAAAAGGADGSSPRREVMRVPSASVLASLRSRPHAGEARVLAWRGAADAMHPALAGAEGEVAFLQRRLAGTRVRDGERANAAPLEHELAPWGVLHFAAHARALEQTPWESGLLCADSVASGGAGWLTARQIAAMHLDARLAFLSGCRTAGGREKGGEGVMGLTSAFQSAGVPSVVASLWTVDDVATARLTEVFYERLLAGDTVSGALEAARRALRRDPETAHPHYWAGFVVSGDGAQRIPLRARGFGRF